MAALRHDPKTFGYNDPDPGVGGLPNNDDGWGCVYRAFQNVQSFLGAPVSRLADLLQACGRVAPQWAEPAMFARPEARGLLPEGWTAESFLVGDGKGQWLRYTRRSEYVASEPTAVFNVGPTLAPRTAFVVDDGVSGFAVVPDKGYWWWVDPHVPVGERLSPDVVTHLRKPAGWMVLRVTRPPWP